MSKTNLSERIFFAQNNSIDETRNKYSVGADSQSWSLSNAVNDLIENASEKNLIELDYRPLDRRWTAFTGTQSGFHFFPANKVSRHLVGKANLALCYTRKIEGGRQFADIMVSPGPISLHTLSIKEVNSFAPLYHFPIEQESESEEPELKYSKGGEEEPIRVNFDPKLYARIREAAGLTGPLLEPDGSDAFRTATGAARPDEVKVFDYIYGVLHCPAYRATYAEFLKIDFPRVPFPPSPAVFADVSAKGEALRRLHLMEDAAIGQAKYLFHGEGDCVVAKPSFGGGRVWINPTQYFEGVPDVAWTFHIGGYQPAQKWLKDRKGRQLSYDDLRHYQKIIKILSETDRIMREIELPLD